MLITGAKINNSLEINKKKIAGPLGWAIMKQIVNLKPLT